ncbi:hypothetical protein [Pseudoalteromonas phage PH357]|nr:hypothetical protein [Pseudoalteromonas phage PH357]
MKDDIQQLFIENRVPVFLKEPSYEERLKKKSHKARKHAYNDERTEKLPCLEWGNASVVFQFAWSEELYLNLVSIWEKEYSEKGLDFNVELYEDVDNVIEWRIMHDKPYYTTRRKGFESVLDSIRVNVLYAWESVPESIRELVELCYLSDWDYLEFGEEI